MDKTTSSRSVMSELHPFFCWRSLRTRITVGILVAVILALWLGTLSISHLLRRDMEAAISAQQYSAVALVSMAVDRSIRERQAVLENIAGRITPAMLARPASLNAFLEGHGAIPQLFNWGAIITDREGLAIASFPPEHQREGTPYGDILVVRQVLKEGQIRVSDPIVGKRTGQPVVSIVVPILGVDGSVLGTVMGVTNLAVPSFLDDISSAKYGNTGDFFITAPVSRIYVASSDRRRVMFPGPPRGINPVYDRYIDGYEGSGIARSSRGIVELSSSKRITSTGWLMQSVLPAEEAFAPIGEMQRNLMLISLLLTVLAGALAWWWLRRQLRPLEEASGQLQQMGDGRLPRQSLPIRHDDEIGQLARAFNGLLVSIQAEEAKAAEHAANRRLRKIVSHVPGVVFQYRLHVDGTGSFPFASDAIRDIYGVEPEEVELSADKIRAMAHPDDAVRFFTSMGKSAMQLTPWKVDYRICYPGGIKWLLVDAVPEKGADGAITWYGFVTDITQAKANEAELRIAAATFESQEGIFITDAQGVIVRVNRAFTEITGYEDAEVVGRTPAVLKSGRHDPHFYRELWGRLLQDGCWRGEIWNRRKGGEFYAAWTTISSVRDGEGRTSHYVATFTDVTEHKVVEEQIQRLAFYDPLTSLPNRRLFLDRLDQALVAAARNHTYGALMFLDLDQFKSLNDRYGHILGDELLVEVARRLSLCVRGSDTVARLGGDEFVVMLQSLDNDPVAGDVVTQALTVAEKIRQTLAEPYLLQPEVNLADQVPILYECTVSIGIGLFMGKGEHRDELIRQADVAMYEAKAAGRNAIRVFGQEVVVGRGRRIDEGQPLLH